ncbi:DUF4874 domain-containing protein [Streptomyces sp. NPDC001530]|uniref:DUF4874 domain-containing protein n=1 Tax=Streptomyces sp. NPDC001530 TaxID=3364582 RepID=UPI00367ABCF5
MRHPLSRRQALALAGLTGAGAVLGVSGRAAADTTWTTVSHRGIRPDDTNGTTGLANPSRGFRYEMSYNASDLTSPWPHESGFAGDSAKALGLLEAKYGAGARVTQLYFYLWDYATTTIPSSALANIQKIFDGLRSKGYQAVLRFCYDDDVRSRRPYTVQDIQRHITQLAPIVAANRDVIAVWQAGFVGAWGEWGPNYYNHQNWPDATTAIMTSLVDALPAGMDTQMRYPWLRDSITTSSVKSRVGLHNDFFTLGGGCCEYYVPSNQWWSTYLEVTPTHTMDGEMPWDKGQSADPNAWSTPIDGLNAAKRLQTLRFDTLSQVHNATVTIPAWRTTTLTKAQATAAKLPVSDGYFTDSSGNSVPRTYFDYIRDHLGYRIEVQQARYAKLPSGLSVQVDLVNRGFAAPKNPRVARLALLNRFGQTVSTVDTGADWRTWLPGPRSETSEPAAAPATQTITGTLPLPATPGTYFLALLLPHPTTSAAAYAVRCANASVWFLAFVKGENVLATITL